MFNGTLNVFEVLSRNEDRFAARSQANDLTEATASVTDKEEVAAEVWERSAAVGEAQQYAISLHLEHVNRALISIELYTKNKNWERWVINELLGPEASNVSDLLHACVAAALRFVNQGFLLKLS